MAMQGGQVRATTAAAAETHRCNAGRLVHIVIPQPQGRLLFAGAHEPNLLRQQVEDWLQHLQTTKAGEILASTLC